MGGAYNVLVVVSGIAPLRDVPAALLVGEKIRSPNYTVVLVVIVQMWRVLL